MFFLRRVVWRRGGGGGREGEEGPEMNESEGKIRQWAWRRKKGEKDRRGGGRQKKSSDAADAGSFPRFVRQSVVSRKTKRGGGSPSHSTRLRIKRARKEKKRT